MSEQFGKLNLAGKKESSVQTEKAPNKSSEQKLTFIESSDAFESAEEIVKLLEKCAGDLDSYAGSFDSRIGTKQAILSRSLFTLSLPGNDAFLQRWESLIKCFKQARLLVKEREAFDALTHMPVPKETELKNWSTTQWHTFATFWLGDLREESKSKAKKAQPIVSDPALVDLVKILREREVAKNQPDFFADEIPPMADEYVDKD